MISIKRTAPISGLLYLVIALTGFYAILYVPQQMLRTERSADAILSQELLFQSGVIANLICQTCFIFLALQLYKLFVQVNKQLSFTLLLLATTSVPISFLIIFHQLYTFSLLSEAIMLQADPVQLQISTLSFLKIFDYGNILLAIFWGLWLLPFGWVAIQSNYMPKLFGYLLITTWFMLYD